MADRSITVNVRANTSRFNAGMTQASARTRALADASRIAGAGVRGLGAAGRGAHGGLTQVASGATTSQRSLAQMSTAGTGAMGALRGGITGTMAPMAGFAALMGTGLGIKSVIDQGNSMTVSMESWKAISGATSAQMEQMRGVAHGLGEDMSLPTVTAAGAAEAMLALSKANFSAEDSMEAVRAICVLATAEMIDVETAATMAGDMMNQFGLKAADTGRVVDVLTSATNASTISVTDMYDSMKYIGPVANAAKISFEDTATAVAMLGNAGIKGGEAGTALRGMLASIAAPSKQAGEAMRELGVEVYDQQGKFKGLKPVIEQLTSAKKRMTDQEFSSAVVTAFGRETLSAVMELARQGPKTWDSTSEAVRKHGSATELAAVKTKGLGGAINGLNSQLAMLGTRIYDAVAPHVEKLFRQIANLVKQTMPLIPAAFDKAKEAAVGFGSIASSVFGVLESVLGPIVSLAGSLASGFGGLSGPLQATALGIAAIVAMRGRVSDLGTSMGRTGTEIRRIADLNREMRPEIHRTATAFEVLGKRSPAVAEMGHAFMTAHGGAQTFGRTAGYAAAAGKGLQLAGSGIMGLFGGPLGFALTGATAAVGLWADANAKAKQKAEEHRTKVAELGREIYENNGRITRATAVTEALGAAQTKVGGFGKNLRQVLSDQGITMGDLTDAFHSGAGGLKALAERMREGQQAAEDELESLARHGKGQSKAADAARDHGVQAGLAADKLEELAGASSEQATHAQRLAEANRKGAHSLTSASDATKAYEQALKTLSSESATATERGEALFDVWERLIDAASGGEKATKQWQSAVKKAAEETEAAKKAAGGAIQVNKEWSSSVIKAGGDLSDTGGRSEELTKALIELRKKTANVIETTADLAEGKETMAQTREAAIGMAKGMGLSEEAAKKVVDQLKMTPETVETLMKINGGDEAVRKVEGVRIKLLSLADKKEIVIKAPDRPVIAELERIGFKVKELPNGNVRITVDDENAWLELAKLDAAELADKVQKSKGDNSDAKKKYEEIEKLTPGKKIWELNADAADAARKQADVIAGGEEIEKQKPTQHLGGNEKGASKARQSAFQGGAALNRAVFTQHLSGNETGARQARAAAEAGGNQLQRNRKTQYIDGNRSGFDAVLNSIRFMAMPTRSISIVADVVGKAKSLLGFSAGGFVEAYAGGGLRDVPDARPFAQRAESHVAQFAHAGAYRVWAEPETGGEAYIPLAPAKRVRSKAIAEEVISRFGGQVAWGPTVRQEAGGTGMARLERRLEHIERLTDALVTAGPRTSGPAVSIGTYQQQSGASASEVAHELQWLSRGRGR
ncbi:phage tail tape measure protein [Streptomyces celluloflavus]|uniref:phage tail tape measure protein n=1 Tax=Streptomyces celluloflavus TaxID=58344 RepID=UPI0036CB0789